MVTITRVTYPLMQILKGVGNMKSNNRIYDQTVALLAKDPEAVIRAVLEEPCFLPTLKAGAEYSRFGDDARNGSITLLIGDDGDAHISVTSDLDPDEFTLFHRFRTFIGGGMSLRVWAALRILAVAIHIDNQEYPQHHAPVE